MLSLAPEKRYELLSKRIPEKLCLQGEQTSLNTFVILSPASRDTLRGMLNTSLTLMEGLFPEDLSKELELDGVEPQLVTLNHNTLSLFNQALKESNGCMVIYSHLELQDLAAQLRPLTEIVNQKNGQLEYLTWWEAQVFPMVMGIMNTERLPAFMGNIHAVGLVDLDMPSALQLYTIHHSQTKVQRLLIDDITMQDDIAYQVLSHVPLPQLMHFNAEDLSAFKEYTVKRQIKQMTHLLASTEHAKSQGKAFHDLINDVTSAARFAYKHYHLTQTRAQYAFIKASFILGGQFERYQPQLHQTLLDEKESNSIKQVRIEKYLNAVLANQVKG